VTPAAWAALAGLGIAGLCALLVHAWLRVRRLRSQLGHAVSELERLHRSFARFAPEEIVERVIAAGASRGGERREVTALFSDLVGSTALASSVPPNVLLEILNGHFERMSRAISAHHGHLSTLIGDGILALFGALGDNPWQSHDACAAALAMRAELALYNRELAAKGLPELAFGVGLHRGSGVAGLVGSPELLQFTVVGTTMSIAARVQQLTREQAADILVTKAVAEHLDARFALEPAGEASLRGFPERVEILRLV
jgi:adenylate cyclase